MTDRDDAEHEGEAGPADDFIDDEGPGSDPGAAYERATEEQDDGGGEPDATEGEEPPSPGVGDVYRSGS